MSSMTRGEVNVGLFDEVKRLRTEVAALKRRVRLVRDAVLSRKPVTHAQLFALLDLRKPLPKRGGA